MLRVFQLVIAWTDRKDSGNSLKNVECASDTMATAVSPGHHLVQQVVAYVSGHEKSNQFHSSTHQILGFLLVPSSHVLSADSEIIKLPPKWIVPPKNMVVNFESFPTNYSVNWPQGLGEYVEKCRTWIGHDGDEIFPQPNLTFAAGHEKSNRFDRSAHQILSFLLIASS